MNYIDAHAHVWTPDTIHYPLGEGWKKEDMSPASFTAEELLKHAKAAGVTRINLIQMSYYYPKDPISGKGKGFDNSYMTDMIGAHKGTFVGTAVIDPAGDDPARLMTDMAKKGIRAFRVLPRLTGSPPAKWLQPAGYDKMFAQGAKNNQAISCLIDPDCLPEVDRMCRKHPGTPVIIDHLARIGVTGTIKDEDVKALCDLARHKKVLVKVGAFYALGKKKPPYDDLAGLIEKVVKAYGPERCMWESDSPFQVVGGHTYKESIELVKSRLKFLSDSDREWLLRKTAEKFFFGG
jgi:predicted TIM-barrel fold metal-dependent hydrolase